MKECENIRQKLSALLDSELPSDETATVETHLQSCDTCHREWKSLQKVDQQCTQLLTIDEVERQVAAIVQAEPNTLTKRDKTITWRPIAIIVAIAASVLLLVFLNRDADVRNPAPELKIAAQLVRATGAVEILAPESTTWTVVDAGDGVSLADGSRLRTRPNVLCELQTADQGKLRLDESGELVVRDSSQVELVKGQLWCLAPKDKLVSVHVPLRDDQSRTTASVTCLSASEFQCSTDNNKATVSSLSTTDSDATCTIGSFVCPVAPGETVAIDSHQSVERNLSPSFASKVWQLPLLAVGNTPDKELMTSLSQLLAPIGRTKARHMNEQQIRALGPPGAIPLLAYALAESSPEQLSLRRTSANLACELADWTAIELLHELTLDPDTFISNRATSALERIAKQAD